MNCSFSFFFQKYLPYLVFHKDSIFHHLLNQFSISMEHQPIPNPLDLWDQNLFRCSNVCWICQILINIGELLKVHEFNHIYKFIYYLLVESIYWNQMYHFRIWPQIYSKPDSISISINHETLNLLLYILLHILHLDNFDYKLEGINNDELEYRIQQLLE